MPILAPSSRSLLLLKGPTLLSGAQGRSYHHLPFQFPEQRQKGRFAAKLVVFLAVPFMIPFVAVGYQLNKSGGAAAA